MKRKKKVDKSYEFKYNKCKNIFPNLYKKKIKILLTIKTISLIINDMESLIFVHFVAKLFISIITSNICKN